MQVSQDIRCLILIHSADADSEKLKSDVCHVDIRKYVMDKCVGIPLMDSGRITRTV